MELGRCYVHMYRHTCFLHLLRHMWCALPVVQGRCCKLVQEHSCPHIAAVFAPAKNPFFCRYLVPIPLWGLAKKSGWQSQSFFLHHLIRLTASWLIIRSLYQSQINASILLICIHNSQKVGSVCQLQAGGFRGHFERNFPLSAAPPWQRQAGNSGHFENIFHLFDIHTV